MNYPSKIFKSIRVLPGAAWFTYSLIGKRAWKQVEMDVYKASGNFGKLLFSSNHFDRLINLIFLFNVFVSINILFPLWLFGEVLGIVRNFLKCIYPTVLQNKSNEYTFLSHVFKCNSLFCVDLYIIFVAPFLIEHYFEY